MSFSAALHPTIFASVLNKFIAIRNVFWHSSFSHIMPVHDHCDNMIDALFREIMMYACVYSAIILFDDRATSPCRNAVSDRNSSIDGGENESGGPIIETFLVAMSFLPSCSDTFARARSDASDGRCERTRRPQSAERGPGTSKNAHSRRFARAPLCWLIALTLSHSTLFSLTLSFCCGNWIRMSQAFVLRS